METYFGYGSYDDVMFNSNEIYCNIFLPNIYQYNFYEQHNISISKYNAVVTFFKTTIASGNDQPLPSTNLHVERFKIDLNTINEFRSVKMDKERHILSIVVHDEDTTMIKDDLELLQMHLPSFFRKFPKNDFLQTLRPSLSGRPRVVGMSIIKR